VPEAVPHGMGRAPLAVTGVRAQVGVGQALLAKLSRFGASRPRAHRAVAGWLHHWVDTLDITSRPWRTAVGSPPRSTVGAMDPAPGATIHGVKTGCARALAPLDGPGDRGALTGRAPVSARGPAAA
jgi:hypothetical protein